jgi:hypothetical protein
LLYCLKLISCDTLSVNYFLVLKKEKEMGILSLNLICFESTHLHSKG